jgi:hypothetical protein
MIPLVKTAVPVAGTTLVVMVWIGGPGGHAVRHKLKAPHEAAARPKRVRTTASVANISDLAHVIFALQNTDACGSVQNSARFSAQIIRNGKIREF